MRKFSLLLILIGLWALPTSAQFRPRDYAVSVAGNGYQFAPDETTFTLMFIVTNQGGNATAATEMHVYAGEKLDAVATQTLDPLQNGKSQEVEITLNTWEFPGGSTQSLRVEVGIDDFELAGSVIATDNFIMVSVPIPSGITRPPATPATGGSTPAPNATEAPAEQPNNAGSSSGFTLPITIGENGAITFNGTTYPPEQILIFAIALLGGILLLWLLTVILRLVFRRSPKFGVWQPAYATMPTMDPGSVAGRQQAWQNHAQNGTILAAPTEGNLHAIKLLLDQQGNYMNKWRITALRLSQYDSYGRVGRTEVIAPKWVINRLNKLLLKNSRYSHEALSKQIRPIARSLVKTFRSSVKQRSAHLPVALDVRFEGKQGEVRIAFELYQCRQFMWYRLDRWEPVMAVLGSRLLENYTYTIHGMSGGETPREFYTRLPDDLEWLLAETLRNRMASAQEAPSPQAYQIPDTLSGMKPVVEQPRG